MARQKNLFYIPEDDGWTKAGYLAELPNVHDALRFTYRPTLIQERSKIIAALHGKKSHLQDAELAKALAYYIKSWSVVDLNDKPAPVTAKFIERLNYQVFDRLLAIVIYGSGASDTDPEWDQETLEEEDLLEYESADKNKKPALVVQETMEGN